jgi:hypothetical protein
MKKLIAVVALFLSLLVPCILLSGQDAGQVQHPPASHAILSEKQVAQILSESGISKENLAPILTQLDSGVLEDRQKAQARLEDLGRSSLKILAEAAADPSSSAQVRESLTQAVRYIKNPGLAPYVVAAFNADLIIAGEIVSDGSPLMVQDITFPGEQKPQKVAMQVFEMKVSEVIRYNFTQGREGWAVPASQPATLDGRTIKIMVAADEASRPAAPWAQPLFPKKGLKLIAALQRVAGRDEYYLSPPGDTATFRADMAAFRAEATDANIQAFKRARRDVTYWPWGKAVDGLRLALIVSDEYEFSGNPIQHVKGKQGLNVTLEMAVALQNVSGKLLAVNLYDLKDGLSVRATDANDDTRGGTPYGGQTLPAKRPREFDKSYVKMLQPGQVAMVGSEGLAPLGCSLEILLDYRSWKLSAAYEVDRDAKTEDGQALWKGKLQSAPVDINVVRVPAININKPGQAPPT